MKCPVCGGSVRRRLSGWAVAVPLALSQAVLGSVAWLPQDAVIALFEVLGPSWAYVLMWGTLALCLPIGLAVSLALPARCGYCGADPRCVPGRHARAAGGGLGRAVTQPS